MLVSEIWSNHPLLAESEEYFPSYWEILSYFHLTLYFGKRDSQVLMILIWSGVDMLVTEASFFLMEDG